MRKNNLFLQISFFVLIGVGLLSCNSVANNSSYSYEYLYKDLPFDMPVLTIPTFPDYSVSITDFGGVGDGIDMNTNSFKEAIDHLSEKGGGKLIVPAGVWFTGPIVLKSNINLHLEDRAIILFSPDKSLYPIVETSFEGFDTRRCQSPIWGKNIENIAITGSGAIDGNGHFWRPVKKDKVTERQWQRIISRGGAFKRDDYWMPSAQYLHGDTISNMNVPRHLNTDEEWNTVKDFLRPVMVSLQNCTNVFLQGVIFQNSPAWNIHPLMCENLIIDGIHVRNPSYAQNGDGLDIESCKNTIVVNSTFDVGDDGICVKSGKDEDGRKRNMRTENLIVDNCTVFKGHGGFVVGSEMSGGVRNVFVSNCQFLGTDVGLRFKSRRGRGGTVENIYISKINMFDIGTEPLLFNLHYGGKSAIESLIDGDQTESKEMFPPVDETTPIFRDIYIDQIICKNARRAMYFRGLPEQNIENINIRDVVITSKVGAELQDSKKITLQNVKIYPDEGPVIILNNVKDVIVDDLKTSESIASVFEIDGVRSENITIPSSFSKERTQIGENLKQNVINFN